MCVCVGGGGGISTCPLTYYNGLHNSKPNTLNHTLTVARSFPYISEWYRFFGWELNEYEVRHWKYVALAIALKEKPPEPLEVEADSIGRTAHVKDRDGDIHVRH